MGEPDMSQVMCTNCQSEDGCYEDNGQFFCNVCHALIVDIVETGVADEDFLPTGAGQGYNAAHTRHVSSQPQLIKCEELDIDHMGPREPADFGNVRKGVVFSEQDYYKSIRMRYLLGVQLLVQYQCEALVEKFKVNPVICGIAAEVWLRFVVSTKVLDDSWADNTIAESEQGEKRIHKGNLALHEHEPRNFLFNERVSMIWCKSLKKTIPLYYSLAVSYLACHMAREPVLPTDILKWSVEGKLPYFQAFPIIEESIKQFERNNECSASICPLTANYMFRPLNAVPAQKIETTAASIAKAVGLNLPPVNFYAIACRYLKQLHVPVAKIVSYAGRIQKWAMPPGLWLSAHDLRLPTRVCVMSILVVTIRILYNINGFGKWEGSLSTLMEGSSMDEKAASLDEFNLKDGAEERSNSPGLDRKSDEHLSSAHKYETECAELLKNLEKIFDGLNDNYEYSKDLPSYLQYCKDVVFSGLEPLYKDPNLTEEFWDFYQKNQEGVVAGSNQKRDRDCDKVLATPMENKKRRDDETNCGEFEQEDGLECDQSGNHKSQNSEARQPSPPTETVETSPDSLRDISIRHLKIDMEEHRFNYIPPRVNVKRQDYLHYCRKAAGDGFYAYVAHADYYLLLRACAKVAQVDVRVMHYSVLSLERRLGWIETRINECVDHFNNLGKATSSTSMEEAS